MNMRAAVVHAFDQPPRYMEFPVPTPNSNEVTVRVLAAGLHPIVKSIANGEHYSAGSALPFIPGIDGVGELEDGTRVYFGAARAPYGTMAEQTVVNPQKCMPLPDELDTITAAAVFNPGLSSWLALTYQAQLVPHETVLINGATGVAGRLAVQIAKHLGAGKVIVTGRNQESLSDLHTLGADALIRLDQPSKNVIDDITQATNEKGVNIIIDYLWGNPAELLISALTQKNSSYLPTKIRFIQVGDSAGKTITLPASALRSSQLELRGSGLGSIPIKQIVAAVPQFTEFAASGKLSIKTEQRSLADIQKTWQEIPPDGCRFVIVP